MKNTDLLTHSEKNQQADRLWAEKSGYYEMNAVSFLSCCFKMETRRLLRRSLRLPNENGHKARQGCN